MVVKNWYPLERHVMVYLGDSNMDIIVDLLDIVFVELQGLKIRAISKSTNQNTILTTMVAF